MNGWGWRRWTGVLGVLWFAIQLAAVVLFVVAGNPPSFDDAKKYADFISSGSALFLADAFLTSAGTVVLLLVLTGLRRVVRAAGEDWEWAAALSFGTGLVVVAIGITGAAVEATAAFVSTSGTEPTMVRTAWLAAGILFTFIYLPSSVLLGTVSYVERACCRAGLGGWVPSAPCSTWPPC